MMQLELYIHRRPVALATRSLEVLTAALWVGSGLLYDQATGGMKRNAPQRAKQVSLQFPSSKATFLYAPL